MNGSEAGQQISRAARDYQERAATLAPEAERAIPTNLHDLTNAVARVRESASMLLSRLDKVAPGGSLSADKPTSNKSVPEPLRSPISADIHGNTMALLDLADTLDQARTRIEL